MDTNYWYMECEWVHDDPDDPVGYYGEIDGDGWEIRKVDVYRDGTMLFADKDRESDDTYLSPYPIPSLEEIAEDPEFRPKYISKSEFEAIWDQVVAADS